MIRPNSFPWKFHERISEGVERTSNPLRIATDKSTGPSDAVSA